MVYTNWRVSPTSTSPNPLKLPSGRSYVSSVGSFLDVPDFDAHLLIAAGWVRLDGGPGPSAGAGTTANRPITATKGTKYLDTTVGANVVADGKGSWLHHVTGAVS